MIYSIVIFNSIVNFRMQLSNKKLLNSIIVSPALMWTKRRKKSIMVSKWHTSITWSVDPFTSMKQGIYHIENTKLLIFLNS